MAQNPQANQQGPQGNSWFTSVMDHFRQPAGGTPPAGGPGNTGVPGAGGTPQNQSMSDLNNPLVPAGQGSNQQNNEPKSPMADFADLWKTPEVKAGEQPQVDWNDPLSIVPAQTLDATKIGEAAKKVDFSRVLNPETIKKALAGDVGAFSEALNSVAQATFSNSALIASRIVDSTLRQMAPRLVNDALPHHMKRHGVGEGFGAENPMFNDPAVKPMLDMVTAQFQKAYPKSSAKEITDKAKAYVLAFANGVSGKGGGNTNLPGNPKPGAGKDMDWIGDFLEGATADSNNQGPQI